VILELCRRLYAALFVRDRTRITPQIRAEVTLLLEESGHVAVYFAKLDPEQNPTEIYGMILMRYLAALSQMGITLDFETDEHVLIPLVRPAK
jgi:hypothetical protein